MSAYYELSRIKLSALCDFVKSDGFRYPLAELPQDMWDKMRTDKLFKSTLVTIGKMQLQLQISKQIYAKFAPQKPAHCYEFSIRSDVLQREVLSLIRDTRYNAVEPSSHGLDPEDALLAIAGALCVDNEERAEKWVKGIYGPLIDIIHNIEDQERLRRRAISLQRLDYLRYTSLYPVDMNPRSIPHALAGISHQEAIRRYQGRKIFCLMFGEVKQYY